MRRLALTGLGLMVLAAGCGRRGAPSPEAVALQRRRCLELFDTLPRLEAEQRAWPRSASLACDEHGEARAREVEQLGADLAAACAVLPAAALRPALEAVEEVRRCASCAPSFAAACARARERLAEAELGISAAGLR